jgi:radical SAM superfamily enzyme YgiQ (UPF0313 family)
MFGRKVRFRSPVSVVSEMEECVNTYNIHHFEFIDDTLTVDKPRIMKICDEIIASGLKVRWGCTTRVHTVDKPLLIKMRQAGCFRINYGVESGNSEILKKIKKGITLDQAKRAVKWTREAGIESGTYFMLGHPYETKETIKETIKFAKELDPDLAGFSILTPLPGTEVMSMIERGEGGIRLVTQDWSKYVHYGNAVIEGNDFTREDLLKFQKKALLSFYTRPKSILRISTNPEKWPATIRSAYALFKAVLMGRKI